MSDDVKKYCEADTLATIEMYKSYISYHEEKEKELNKLHKFKMAGIAVIIALGILLVSLALTCVGLGYAVSEERSKNEKLQASLTEAQNDLQECSKEIESLETRLYESRQESLKWEEMAEQLDKTVSEMKTTIADLEEQIILLQEEILRISQNDTSGGIPHDETDVKILAGMMFGEEEGNLFMAGGAGSVAINRVHDPRFPSTIRDVIYEKVVTKDAVYEQYAPRTKSIIECVLAGKPIPKSLADIEYVPQWYFDLAETLLTHGSILPEKVVYQAHFPQGTSVFWEWNGEYLCFG